MKETVKEVDVSLNRTELGIFYRYVDERLNEAQDLGVKSQVYLKLREKLTQAICRYSEK